MTQVLNDQEEEEEYILEETKNNEDNGEFCMYYGLPTVPNIKGAISQKGPGQKILFYA